MQWGNKMWALSKVAGLHFMQPYKFNEIEFLLNNFLGIFARVQLDFAILPSQNLKRVPN